jgi:NhaC family Na+:H+ antiporter
VLLIVAAVSAGLVGWHLGYSWEEMQQGIVESIRKAMPAILIMLCVGMLIAAWMASGTIPMLLYYGLKLVSPRFFLVTACLVCSMTSLATGTSWGTVGTVGVAFIGIAQALRYRWDPLQGRSLPGPTSATSFLLFPTFPTWPRSRPGRTFMTISATCSGRPCRPGWPVWAFIFSWA